MSDSNHNRLTWMPRAVCTTMKPTVMSVSSARMLPGGRPRTFLTRGAMSKSGRLVELLGRARNLGGLNAQALGRVGKLMPRLSALRIHSQSCAMEWANKAHSRRGNVALGLFLV